MKKRPLRKILWIMRKKIITENNSYWSDKWFQVSYIQIWRVAYYGIWPFLYMDGVWFSCDFKNWQLDKNVRLSYCIPLFRAALKIVCVVQYIVIEELYVIFQVTQEQTCTIIWTMHLWVDLASLISKWYILQLLPGKQVPKSVWSLVPESYLMW